MLDLPRRGLGFLALLTLGRLAACGGEAPASPAAGATTASTGATTAGSGGSATTGGGTSATTGAGAGGAAPACIPPATALPELIEPDPRLPWAGGVAILPITAMKGIPVASWRVDSAAMPTPKPDAPYSVLDTRKLPDGEHHLSLDIVEDGGAIKTVDTTFCVANGEPAAPVFTGKLVDVSSQIGLPPDVDPALAMPNYFGAVAGDLDGDGDDDLFVWDVHGGQVYLQTAPWTFTPQGAPFPGIIRSAAMADLDNDGDLDVVAAGVGVKILRNTAGTLVNISVLAGIPPTNSAPLNGFQGMAIADIDQDGLLDVLATQKNCAGGANLMLRNEGDLHFVDVAPKLALDRPDGTTTAAAIDLLEDGSAIRLVLFHESFCEPGITPYLLFLPGPDLPVPGDFQQKHLAGLSPMGTAWIDADGDGKLDQWLAAHVSSPLWRAPDFQETIAPYVGIDSFIDPKGIPYAAWAMVVLDADMDGKADVFVTHDPLVSDANETLADSRHGLFWQQAPGRMIDVGELAGFGAGTPCRGAFGSDIDGDGDTDLLVGCRGSVRALRNDLVKPGPGRSLTLHGTLSNADGAHAIVTTPTGEKRMLSGSGQPFASGLQRQSMRAPSGEFSVLWPSGIVQKVDAGSDPVLHVTEPSVFGVAPRRVPVGGGQSVQVEVNPDAIGKAGSMVVVTANGGAWSKPMAKDADGVWRGTLTPPAQAAVVELSAKVGDLTFRIRPRVFVR